MGDQLASWWSENTKYTYKDFDTADTSTQMFTQMASENVVKVGCATNEKCKGSDFPGKQNFFTICRYGPSGNIVGRKPYSLATNATNEILEYTDVERDLILDKHNTYRQKLLQGEYPELPKPTMMPEIFYCRIFESEAKKIAEKCQFNPTNGVAGTSYAKTSNAEWLVNAPDTSVIVGAQIDSWWSERALYTYGNYDPESAGQNFQRMAWSGLVKVGSATNTNCQGGDFPADEKTFFTVCRYWDVENGPSFGKSLGRLPDKNAKLWPTDEIQTTSTATDSSTTKESKPESSLEPQDDVVGGSTQDQTSSTIKTHGKISAFFVLLISLMRN